MKKLYKICIISISFLISKNSISQTTLAAGDNGFTGYLATPNSPQTDEFSFVLLKNCAAGTVINFTDNAWGNDLVFRTVETTITFTLAAAKVAGTEIKIVGVPGGATGSSVATFLNGSSAGTVTGLPLSLSLNGDQVIAYQSTTPGVAPFTFISAIHMNVYNGSPDPSVTDATNWDNIAISVQTANSSFKPTGLTTGTNAIWIGTQGVISSERNNAKFSESLATVGGANLSTAAGVRAAVNNQAFWLAEFAASGAVPSYTIPTFANFLGQTAPVKLLSFAAQNNISKITTIWQVTGESNFGNYEIERSTDCNTFTKIGTIQATNGPNIEKTYSFNDIDALRQNSSTLCYRLKMIDGNGDISYSETVKVSIKNLTNLSLVNLQNPISNATNFSIVSKTASTAKLQIIDLSGKICIENNYILNVGFNTIKIPQIALLNKGVYIFKLTTTNSSLTEKLIKD